MFDEADKWLKNAKGKLDNFHANTNNARYIAFDMLENAKTTGAHDPMGAEDNLLDEVDHSGKQMDIITHGEKIADILGKVKTINPNLLASQLNKLSLSFEEGTIGALNNVAKCTAIEGVEVSQEELEALREASAFHGLGQDDEDNFSHQQPSVSAQAAGRSGGPARPSAADRLKDDMGRMNIGAPSNMIQSKPSSMVMDAPPRGLAMQQPVPRVSHADPPLQNNLVGGGMGNPMMEQPGFGQMQQNMYNGGENVHGNMQGQMQQQTVGYDNFGGAPIDDPQNMMTEGDPAADELDPEFLTEIETYLKECMENNELSIDMSDTLIKDHGAKMVAAAASLCDQLQELRLQQCGITDEGAIELFNELTCLSQLQVIDLSFNPIGERAMDALTALLNTN